MKLTLVRQERRKHERYTIEGPVYAAVGPEFQWMGHIVNISRSGVAFTYVKQKDGAPVQGETHIQLSDNDDALGVFPFISISDTGGDMADPYSSVEIRYHRGRFGRLDAQQKTKLMSLIAMKAAVESDHPSPSLAERSRR